ncbi:MAG: restriction endonuclease [Oscillospiraceae bacterium]|nr:restriction endonuclease [Oscillospiraceae bacterium]
MVNDAGREAFMKCVDIGNRLIGKTPKAKTSQPENPPQKKSAPTVAFEKYLQSLFDAFNLQPRGSFKIVGEQIDGSFILKDEVYLLEAKWTTKPIDKSQLVVFNEKVSSKSGFTRGLFISFSNFTEEAIFTFAMGRTVNIILMTVQELAVALSGGMDIEAVLWNKAGALGDCGNFNKSVFEM